VCRAGSRRQCGVAAASGSCPSAAGLSCWPSRISGAPFGEGRPRVLAAGRPLLTAARRSHEIRDDLTLEQILDLVVAIAKIQQDPGYLDPILQAALDGLRPAHSG
jgi:hypothetical protein